MQALIFADRLGRELEPLTDRTCVALLPIVGKSVLEHTLETLAAAGLREAIVVVSPFADDLRAALGEGSRWGMRLDYVLTRGEEDPNAVVERFQSRLTDELLIELNARVDVDGEEPSEVAMDWLTEAGFVSE